MTSELWLGLSPLFGFLGLPIGFGAYVFADNRRWRWKWLFVLAVSVLYGGLIFVAGVILI